MPVESSYGAKFEGSIIESDQNKVTVKIDGVVEIDGIYPLDDDTIYLGAPMSATSKLVQSDENEVTYKSTVNLTGKQITLKVSPIVAEVTPDFALAVATVLNGN